MSFTAASGCQRDRDAFHAPLPVGGVVTRWLVTFDDSIVDADTPADALEEAADRHGVPIGATVFVIDLDSIIGTDRCHRMKLGGFEIPEDTTAG